MSELPIVTSPAPSTGRSSVRRLLVHSTRVLVFVGILCMIRFANRQQDLVPTELESNPAALAFVKSVFNTDARLGGADLELDANVISGADDAKLGLLIQTSPMSDTITGYSGPTNCLVAVDLNNQILAVRILASADTLEHVEIVKDSDAFFESFRGLGRDASGQWQGLDAVSGASLTSYAIISSVANRMGGVAPSLKFKPRPRMENVVSLFPDANTVEESDRSSVWNVFDSKRMLVGKVLTTTPEADGLIGYQGPTAVLIAFDRNGKCIGLKVDQSYDNQPYSHYLDDDYSFLSFYQGKTIEELATYTPEENEIDGVSGATMTTMAVAQGIPLAAAGSRRTSDRVRATPSSTRLVTRSVFSYWADCVTVFLTIIGVALSFTRLSRWKWGRFSFQVASIVMLGFVAGHMLSQTSVAGWSVHAIPWRVAPGLVFLSMAAVVVPVFSKHQPYCQHICPFGALQQLGRNRMGWKVKISKSVKNGLRWIPFLLLGWVILVAVSSAAFNLASIEPFDAFGFRVAGWASIIVFAVGLIASMFSPMAYCRYGCPTGAMLNFLKFQANSDRLGGRDAAAFALLILATVVMFFTSAS